MAAILKGMVTYEASDRFSGKCRLSKRASGPATNPRESHGTNHPASRPVGYWTTDQAICVHGLYRRQIADPDRNSPASSFGHCDPHGARGRIVASSGQHGTAEVNVGRGHRMDAGRLRRLAWRLRENHWPSKALSAVDCA